MRSLFFKIFLWFWLTTVLVGGAFVGIDLIGRIRHDTTRRQTLLGHIVTLYGEHAVDRWINDGWAGLQAYCGQLQKTDDMQIALFAANGEELSGRSVPRGAAELATRLATGGPPLVEHTATGPLVAARVTDADGNQYVFVAKLVRGPLGDLLTRPLLWAWRPLVIVLVGGIVCYALARHVTAPIRRLRAATRRFAAGDLSVRVTPAGRPRRDEIGDLGRDFDFMVARIEDVLTSQHRLIQDISHELRSPLARLNVALELARRDAGEGATNALNRIEREAGVLNELIGRLLSLAGFENDASKQPQYEVDLRQIVTEVAADAEYEARARSRRVRVLRSAPARVRGVPEVLRSALENVVRNAVRYTAEDTEVEITLDLVRVEGEERSIISVRDHGPGVPPEALERIFQPFYRVADARERDTGGAGLGLAITRRAIQWHGGTVAAESAADGGLIVHLTLPDRTSGPRT
jgi:signal transduction histidine kinase